MLEYIKINLNLTTFRINMNKNERAVLRLIKQEEEKHGVAFKSDLIIKANILNIQPEDFQKMVESLCIRGYLTMNGRCIYLTNKGKSIREV